MTELPAVYLADAIYNRLLAALMAIEPTFTGKVEDYQVVELLGGAGIWPSSVEPKTGHTRLITRQRLSVG